MESKRKHSKPTGEDDDRSCKKIKGMAEAESNLTKAEKRPRINLLEQEDRLSGENTTEQEKDVDDDPNWTEEGRASPSPQASSEEDSEEEWTPKKPRSSSEVGGEKQVGKHQTVGKNRDKSQAKKKTCKVCQAKMLDLNRHMREVHDKNQVKVDKKVNGIKKRKKKTCETCQLEVINLSAHMQIHENLKKGRQTCPICARTVLDIRSHMYQSHPKDKGIKNICNKCKRRLTSAYSLKHHMIGHEKDEGYQTQSGTHICGNCMKRYSVSSKLASHRAYFCSRVIPQTQPEEGGDDLTGPESLQLNEGCDDLKGPGSLQLNEGGDDLTRPKRLQVRKTLMSATCKKCGKTFSSFSALRSHNNSVHMNKGAHVHKCHICGKGFSDEVVFRKHMNHHARGIVRIKCRYCQMIFTDAETLGKHERKEHRHKLCEYCGQNVLSRNVSRHRKQCISRLEIEIGQPTLRLKETGGSNSGDEVKQPDSDEQPVSGADSKIERGDYDAHKPKRHRQHKVAYECSNCPLAFEISSNYEAHKEVCQRSAASKGKASESLLIEMEKKPLSHEIFTCDTCQEIFPNSVYLCSHEVAHQWVECDLCQEIIPDDHTLQMHKLLECPKKYEAEEVKAESCSDIPSTTSESVGHGNASSSSVKKCGATKFLCSICDKQFKDADHLQVHKLIHNVHVKKYHGETAYLQKRKSSLNQLNEADKDVELQTADNICDSCNVSFATKEAAQEHKTLVALTSSIYPMRCPYCDHNGRIAHQSECDFLQHKKLFKYSCQFCSQHFEDQLGLRRHLRKSHDFEDKKQCPGCSRWFGPQKLLLHMEQSMKAVDRLECTCLSCGIVFDSVEKLDEHGAKFVFKCRICFQHFQWINTLLSHEKNQHNLSPKNNNTVECVCKHCDQTFERMIELSAHVKSVILESEPTGSMLCAWEDRLKTCFSCGIAFQNQIDYNIHKSIWSFRCDYCHKHFRKMGRLEFHMKDHGQKQKVGGLPCKYCGQKFDTVMAKRAHETRSKYQHKDNVRNKLEVFSCNKCGEEFGASCQLDNHRQTQKCKTKMLNSIYEICIVCKARLKNLYQKSEHMKEHEAVGELSCDFCNKSFESLSSTEFRKHERPQKKKSICTVCNSKITASCEIGVHSRSCIEGKTCAYCLQVIKDSSVHQRTKPIYGQLHGYQCTGCGMKTQSRCMKKTHDATYHYICLKCNQHFETFTQLVNHLMASVELWETCIKSGHIVHVCSCCGEEVENEEQKYEHDAMFRFKCWSCKKHFSSALETSHHFCWTGHAGKNVKHNTSKSFNNILQNYMKKSKCRRRQLDNVSDISAAKSEGVKYQIGRKIYSILPSNIKPKEGMMSDIAPAYDSESHVRRTLQNTSEDKVNFYQRGASGLLYACRRCSLSFDTLSAVENHDCNVCCYCKKRFYGEDVGEKKKQHEENCRKYYTESNIGTSTIDDEENTNSCVEYSKINNTSQKEESVMLGTDASDKQDVVGVESLGTGMQGDDDAMCTMDSGEDQHQGNEAVESTKKIGQLESGLENGEEENKIDKIESDISSQVQNRIKVIKEENKIETLGACNNGDTMKSVSVIEDDIAAGDKPGDKDIESDNRVGIEPLAWNERIGKRQRKKVQRFIAGDVLEGRCLKGKRQLAGKKSEMKSKMQTHYTCYCTKVYVKNYRLLKQHQSENSLEGIICICVHCNIELKTKCHIAYHLAQYPHACRVCKKHFDQFEKLKKHRSNCNRCTFCQETVFQSKTQHEQHKAWHQISWNNVKLHIDDTDETSAVSDKGIGSARAVSKSKKRKSSKRKSAASVAAVTSKGQTSASVPAVSGKGQSAASVPPVSSKERTFASIPAVYEGQASGEDENEPISESSPFVAMGALINRISSTVDSRNLSESMASSLSTASLALVNEERSVREEINSCKSVSPAADEDSGMARVSRPTDFTKGIASASTVPISDTRKNSVSVPAVCHKGQTSASVPPGKSTIWEESCKLVSAVSGKGESSTSLPAVSGKGQKSTSVPAVSGKGQNSIIVPAVSGKGQSSGSIPAISGKGNSSASVPSVSGKGQNSTSVPAVSGKGQNSTSVPAVSGKGESSASVPTVSGKGQNSTSVPAVSGKGQNSTSVPAFSGKGQNSTIVPAVNEDRNVRGIKNSCVSVSPVADEDVDMASVSEPPDFTKGGTIPVPDNAHQASHSIDAIRGNEPAGSSVLLPPTLVECAMDASKGISTATDPNSKGEAVRSSLLDECEDGVQISFEGKRVPLILNADETRAAVLSFLNDIPRADEFTFEEVSTVEGVEITIKRAESNTKKGAEVLKTDIKSYEQKIMHINVPNHMFASTQLGQLKCIWKPHSLPHSLTQKKYTITKAKYSTISCLAMLPVTSDGMVTLTVPPAGDKDVDMACVSRLTDFTKGGSIPGNAHQASHSMASTNGSVPAGSVYTTDASKGILTATDPRRKVEAVGSCLPDECEDGVQIRFEGKRVPLILDVDETRAVILSLLNDIPRADELTFEEVSAVKGAEINIKRAESNTKKGAEVLKTDIKSYEQKKMHINVPNHMFASTQLGKLKCTWKPHSLPGISMPGMWLTKKKYTITEKKYTTLLCLAMLPVTSDGMVKLTVPAVGDRVKGPISVAGASNNKKGSTTVTSGSDKQIASASTVSITDEGQRSASVQAVSGKGQTSASIPAVSDKGMSSKSAQAVSSKGNGSTSAPAVGCKGQNTASVPAINRKERTFASIPAVYVEQASENRNEPISESSPFVAMGALRRISTAIDSRNISESMASSSPSASVALVNEERLVSGIRNSCTSVSTVTYKDADTARVSRPTDFIKGGTVPGNAHQASHSMAKFSSTNGSVPAGSSVLIPPTSVECTMDASKGISTATNSRSKVEAVGSSLPDECEDGVQISFEGKRVPLIVDAGETRAVILSLLNDIPGAGELTCEEVSAVKGAEIVIKRAESDIKKETSVLKTDVKTHINKKTVSLILPNHMFASTRLCNLICTWQQYSLPGLTEKKYTTLLCLAMLPVTSDGMVKLTVPAAGDRAKRPISVAGVRNKEKGTTLVPPGSDKRIASASTVPITDKRKTSASVAVSGKGPSSTSVPAVSGQGENSTSVPAVSGKGENSTSVPAVSGQGDNSTSVPAVSGQGENSTSVPAVNGKGENCTSVPAVKVKKLVWGTRNRCVSVSPVADEDAGMASVSEPTYFTKGGSIPGNAHQASHYVVATRSSVPAGSLCTMDASKGISTATDPSSKVEAVGSSLQDECEDGVQICFEGVRLPFLVDVDETRAAVFSLLNDIPKKGGLTSEEVNTVKGAEINIKRGTSAGKTDDKVCFEKPRMCINVPKHMFASTRLSKVKCTLLPCSLPGITEKKCTTLSCLAVLSSNSNGMVKLTVPPVVNRAKTSISEADVRNKEKGCSTVMPITYNRKESVSTVPASDTKGASSNALHNNGKSAPHFVSDAGNRRTSSSALDNNGKSATCLVSVAGNRRTSSSTLDNDGKSATCLVSVAGNRRTCSSALDNNGKSATCLVSVAGNRRTSSSALDNNGKSATCLVSVAGNRRTSSSALDNNGKSAPHFVSDADHSTTFTNLCRPSGTKEDDNVPGTVTDQGSTFTNLGRPSGTKEDDNVPGTVTDQGSTFTNLGRPSGTKEDATVPGTVTDQGSTFTNLGRPSGTKEDATVPGTVTDQGSTFTNLGRPSGTKEDDNVPAKGTILKRGSASNPTTALLLAQQGTIANSLSSVQSISMSAGGLDDPSSTRRKAGGSEPRGSETVNKKCEMVNSQSFFHVYDAKNVVKIVTENGEKALVFPLPENCVGSSTPFLRFKEINKAIFSVIIAPKDGGHGYSLKRVNKSLKVNIGQGKVDSIEKTLNLCGQLTFSVVLTR